MKKRPHHAEPDLSARRFSPVMFCKSVDWRKDSVTHQNAALICFLLLETHQWFLKAYSYGMCSLMYILKYLQLNLFKGYFFPFWLFMGGDVSCRSLQLCQYFLCNSTSEYCSGEKQLAKQGFIQGFVAVRIISQAFCSSGFTFTHTHISAAFVCACVHAPAVFI